MSLSPGPVPIAANFDDGEEILTVTFNMPLGAALSPEQVWSFRFDEERYETAIQTVVNVGDNFATVVMGPPSGPDPGDPVVSYSADPPIIAAEASGVPAAPFVDFPLS